MDYKTIKQFVAGRACPLSAENEKGELVIISEGEQNDVHFYETQTAQNNNYVRTNVYWEDGTVEEIFERDEV